MDLNGLVNRVFFIIIISFLLLFSSIQPSLSQIGSGGNPNSPCYVSVDSVPQGIPVMQVTYTDSTGSTVKTINDLGITPLINLHVDEGWQKLFIGRYYNRRSSCEQGMITELYQLNRFDNPFASFNVVMKGN